MIQGVNMTDKDAYRKEHMLIFGHNPVPDLLKGRQCGHAMHDYIGYMMDMPGVDIEIPFDPNEVRTEDDPEALAFQKLYDDETQKWRDVIQDVEEQEEQRKKGRKIR